MIVKVNGILQRAGSSASNARALGVILLDSIRGHDFSEQYDLDKPKIRSWWRSQGEIFMPMKDT